MIEIAKQKLIKSSELFKLTIKGIKSSELLTVIKLKKKFN